MFSSRPLTQSRNLPKNKIIERLRRLFARLTHFCRERMNSSHWLIWLLFPNVFLMSYLLSIQNFTTSICHIDSHIERENTRSHSRVYFQSLLNFVPLWTLSRFSTKFLLCQFCYHFDAQLIAKQIFCSLWCVVFVTYLSSRVHVKPRPINNVLSHKRKVGKLNCSCRWNFPVDLFNYEATGLHR